MDTARVAFIRFADENGKHYIASGFFVNGKSVLTADHVAVGKDHTVQSMLGEPRTVTRVLRSGSADVDLAVLEIDGPAESFSSLRCARVRRDRVHRIVGCTAVGFPRWNKDNKGQRVSAQVEGTVPTAEGLEATADSGLKAGFLTLVGDRKPEHRIPAGGIADKHDTPWGGMSGAAAVVADLVIGVVRSVNLAGDGRSLTVTPISAIEDLPDQTRRAFWEALDVADPAAMAVLPDDGSPAPDEDDDYEYDVFVSYPRDGDVETWIRKRFFDRFKRVLQDELGEQRVYMAPAGGATPTRELRRSRVLLAVLSKQYFFKATSLAELDSMIQRQAEQSSAGQANPCCLVRAISAQDFKSMDSIPPQYRGKFDVIDFTDWVYDFDFDRWELNKHFTDALRQLAEDLAAMARSAPAWRTEFPLRTPVPPRQPPQQKPTF